MINLNSTFKCPVCETYSAKVSQRNLDNICSKGPKMRCKNRECGAFFYLENNDIWDIIIKRDGYTFHAFEHIADPKLQLGVIEKFGKATIDNYYSIPTKVNTLRESAAKWLKLQVMA